jgi:methionyl-tRNA formyltransferase
VLERVARSEHRPSLVVTRPDRPRGRGRRVAAPPVAAAARRLEIELAQPDSVNSDEGRERIGAARPAAVLICAFGGLIREPLLSAYEMLNVHPSLLPRWRGAAPIERAIEAGDRETGVSIMRPVAEMDAGPVCLARSEEIRADDDFGALSARLRVLGGDLLVEALDTRPPCREQPPDGVTVAEKVSSDDRRLDGAAPAAVLERRVRALSPHVGVFVELRGGERLQVLRARVAATAASERGAAGRGTAQAPSPVAGELGRAGDRLLFGCADGALELLVVKPAGGRAMDASAYLRGRANDRGSSPRSSPQSEA